MSDLWPQVQQKQVIVSAYHAADANGDGWIGRPQFRQLLEYLVYFNTQWQTFEMIDVSAENRLSSDAFKDACAALQCASISPLSLCFPC